MEQVKTIYIVDDDEDDRQFMREAITNAIGNVQIVEVQKASDVIVLLDRTNFENWARLILMDINMPGTNGVEMLALIKQHPKYGGIPVVLISTTADQPQVDDAYAAGANAFIVKPTNFAAYNTIACGLSVCFLNERSCIPLAAQPTKNKIKTIVVVEDNDDHWYLMSHALRYCLQEYNIIRLVNRERAILFFDQELANMRPAVNLILIDLYLPDREDGLYLIRLLNTLTVENKIENVPVVVCSYSDNVQDASDCYRNHANTYLVKPLDSSAWGPYFENLIHFWSQTNKPPSRGKGVNKLK